MSVFVAVRQPFQVSGYFETSAPNDSKITTNSIFITNVHESHLSVSFGVRTTLFELHSFVRQVHQITLNAISKYTQYMDLLSHTAMQTPSRDNTPLIYIVLFVLLAMSLCKNPSILDNILLHLKICMYFEAWV